MRKFLLIMMTLIIFCIPTTASAKISRDVDDFDNKISISSRFEKMERFDSVFLTKLFKGEKVSHYWTFVIDDMRWWFFNKDYCEIKIDDSISKINVTTTMSNVVNSNTLLTGAIISVPPDMLDQINEASKITFRIYFQDQPPVTWNVPQNVLEEWKTVINSSKN